MRARLPVVGAVALLSTACIAPSVVERGDRAVILDAQALAWRAAAAADVPGTYVSTEMQGPLATSLRKVVYRFDAAGTYTGAGLIDGDPPHFEVISGEWHVEGQLLHLDGGPPATLEVSDDGSLRLSGEEGRVVLRRERER